MIRCIDRFYPVIITIWRGPFTRESGDGYFAEQAERARRAEREGIWLASIAPEGDTPSSAERKYIAEGTKQMPSHLLERTLASYAIVRSPIKRGALTALGWLLSDLTDIKGVASEAEAIEGVRRVLGAKGVDVPDTLTVENLERAIAEVEQLGGRTG